MAAPARNPMIRVLGDAHEDVPAAFMQFYGAVCSIPAVRRVGIADDSGSALSVWVMLDVDDEEQEERVYRALQAYRATTPAAPIDLYLVGTMQPGADFPPDVRVLYERQ